MCVCRFELNEPKEIIVFTKSIHGKTPVMAYVADMWAFADMWPHSFSKRDTIADASL